MPRKNASTPVVTEDESKTPEAQAAAPEPEIEVPDYETLKAAYIADVKRGGKAAMEISARRIIAKGMQSIVDAVKAETGGKGIKKLTLRVEPDGSVNIAILRLRQRVGGTEATDADLNDDVAE